MTVEKLAEILEKHKKWLNDEEGGERANLYGANLIGADLRSANLYGADLRSANLSRADLSGANLYGANLRRADLRSANLYGADLRSADLSSANLSSANLSSAQNLLSTVNYIDAHFERVEEGYIAYKTFNCIYNAPAEWEIKAGAVLTENVNANRTDICGCGINVAPLEWVKREYPGKPIWKVLIRWEWLAGVCVPYNTDGKIRCERVELLEVAEPNR